MRYGIILLFIESLMLTEILMDGNYNSMVSKEHFLSIALENGLPNVNRALGEDLIRIFKLYDVNADSEEIISFCNGLVVKFSEEIPNPMVAKGSMDYVKVLRDWVKVIRQTGISPELIEDLVLRKKSIINIFKIYWRCC